MNRKDESVRDIARQQRKRKESVRDIKEGIGGAISSDSRGGSRGTEQNNSNITRLEISPPHGEGEIDGTESRGGRRKALARPQRARDAASKSQMEEESRREAFPIIYSKI